MTGKCECGRIATILAQYEDGTVEPVCELCYEAKKAWKETDNGEDGED